MAHLATGARLVLAVEMHAGTSLSRKPRPRTIIATDEVGYQAVQDRHYCSDIHATIVNQLGLDYKKMQFQSMGRTFHLIEEGDGPIRQIIAS